jgi:phage repressor protein C with HTH and peptisase S24 domain
MVGKSKGAISAIENEHNGASRKTLRLLAEALECSIDDLLGSHGPRFSRNAQGPDDAPILPAGSRRIPVIGHVIATPDTDGFFDDQGFPPGGGEGYIPWGTTDRNAYAVRVKGDSMYPRYRPGEILVVEPDAALVAGEDVIVRTKDGRKMVKRLLIQRATDVELGSINERHRPLTISLEEIESIHLVVGSVRRGAEL